MAVSEYGGDTSSLMIRRRRNRIPKHLAPDLSLKKLTREFHISGDYLRKIFKNETGITISEYVTSVRM